MATKSPGISRRKKPSSEGAAMDKAFKRATKRAAANAFKVRKTIMVERDGWLVMVNKAGRIVRRVKQLSKPELRAV
jgi:hypothetical protein